MPAIYTDPELEAYREWLPAFCMEAFFQLGGSFHSDDLNDYYKTPFDVGYDAFIAMDHDFIGRDALAEMVKHKDQQRRKVTLEWNSEDTAKIFASYFGDGPRYKYTDLPMPQYAFSLNDCMMKDGKLVGLGVLVAASMNARRTWPGQLNPSLASSPRRSSLLSRVTRSSVLSRLLLPHRSP